MEDRQQRKLQALRDVVQDLATSPLKPEPPLMTAKLKSLRATIKRIEMLRDQQYQATMDMQARTELQKGELRTKLMIPLSRFGRAHFRNVARLERVFQVPHASESALVVAKAAIAMADALAPHAKTVIAAGADRDMLKRLRTDGRALALIAKRSEGARNRRSIATAELAEAFEKGKDLVDGLEGMVLLRHAGDKTRVALWRNARRVSARKGRPRKRRNRGGDDPQPS